MNLVDFYGGGFMIFALAVLEVVAINYIYGMKRVLEDVKFMLGIDLNIYWKFCWGFLIPFSLTFFFFYFTFTFEQITYGGVEYPDAAICKIHYAVAQQKFCIYRNTITDAGYVLTGFALVQVPIWGFYEVFKGPESGIVAVRIDNKHPYYLIYILITFIYFVVEI